MNVLLTGGLGYIGSHTAITLLLNKINVVILDNLDNSTVSRLDRIADITGTYPKFLECDVQTSD